MPSPRRMTIRFTRAHTHTRELALSLSLSHPHTHTHTSIPLYFNLTSYSEHVATSSFYLSICVYIRPVVPPFFLPFTRMPACLSSNCPSTCRPNCLSSTCLPVCLSQGHVNTTSIQKRAINVWLLSENRMRQECSGYDREQKKSAI